MTELQKKIVEENHKLIYDIIYKHNWELEETYDLCAIGLCRAAMTYDNTKGVKFSSYAYKCMHNEVIGQFRKSQAQKRNVLLQSLDANIVDTEVCTLHDIVSNGLSAEDELVLLNINGLNKKELKAVKLASDGYNTTEIGRIMNISQSYASRLLIKAQNKLLTY